MSRLILVRHARSLADDLNAKLRSDPLYTLVQEAFRAAPYHPKTRLLAYALHRGYPLPCDINNISLAPIATRQIEQLARALIKMDLSLVKVWCSPLQRAAATFEYLSTLIPRLKEQRVIFEDSLIERQRGPDAAIFANLRLYLAAHPNEIRKKQHAHALHYSPPGGESFLDVLMRANLFLSKNPFESDRGDVLVIAHHVSITAIRCLIERWTTQDFLTKLVSEKPPNCGMFIYTRLPERLKV